MLIKKILLPFLVLILVILLPIVGRVARFGYYFYVTGRAVEQSRQAGLGFAKICSELNGQPFTLDSISKLNGYTDLNGRVRPSQEDLNRYIQKIEAHTPYTDFHIYHQSWFQDNGVEHTWYCDIKIADDKSIKAIPIFHSAD